MIPLTFLVEPHYCTEMVNSDVWSRLPNPRQSENLLLIFIQLFSQVLPIRGKNNYHSNRNTSNLFGFSRKVHFCLIQYIELGLMLPLSIKPSHLHSFFYLSYTHCSLFGFFLIYHLYHVYMKNTCNINFSSHLLKMPKIYRKMLKLPLSWVEWGIQVLQDINI